MRIAVFTSLYAPHAIGGAERMAQVQAEALAERGHSVQVLTLGDAGSGTARTTLNGVDVVRVGIENLYLPVTFDRATWAKVAWHARDVYNMAMARRARQWATELRPEIVVCHNIAGWSAAVWPAIKSLDLPLVQVLHDQYLRCVRSNMFKASRCETPCSSCRLMRLPHKRLSRLPDAVVGVSRYVTDSMVGAGYFRGVPIRTHIHNVSHIDTRSRSTPALGGAETVFGFMGLLNPGKGIELLLSAFLASAQPHWRLLVAGTGEARYVDQLRASYGDSRVEFLGRQEPGKFYPLLDATVVPSLLDEALGNVVFESMIHGRAVIASRRGGMPEMISDGISGLLFEPQNEGELARALQRFDAQIGSWRARNEDIKALAAPHYCDRDAWITRWETLLRNVASGNPHTGDAGRGISP
jgi:glycosyltransferase involved in cell wall biosynthesis